MVLTGASWTLTGVAMGKAPRMNVDVSVLTFFTMGIGAVVSLCVAVLNGFPAVSLSVLCGVGGALLLSGFFNFWQLDLMARAMQKGHNGIIWGIIQSGFIFPFFMGIIFFDVPFTWVRMAAFAAALLSITLSATAQGGIGAGKWLIPTFAAFLATGLSQSLSNIPSYLEEAGRISSVWRTVFLLSGFVLGALCRNIGKPGSFAVMLKKQACSVALWQLAGLLIFVEIIVNYFLLFPGMDALARANAGAVAYPLMVCVCLLVFDLFSLLVLHEKHKPVQWAALVLCITGVVGLSVDWTNL